MVSVSLKGIRVVKQPDSVSVTEGDDYSFTIGAIGEGISYQWQYSSNGSTWRNCTASGCKTDTIFLTMKTAYDGRQYRCILKDADGEEKISNVATVTLAPARYEIDGVIYENLDGIMTVTGYIGDASSVTVQQEVGGMTVTVIGASAFEGKISLTHVDLPDTIEIIEDYGFADCSSLNQMN